MTDDVSEAPTVLDTTVLSNFAAVDRIGLLTELPRVATTPVVRDELRAGADTHQYLTVALDALGEDVPVCSPTKPESELESELTERIDPGEAQALAVAEARGGTIVTDDGDARSLARRHDVPVTGSIGVLVRSVERGNLEFDAADQSLKRWIDEYGFRAPSRHLEEY